jgi:hypothetical protein
MAKVRFNLKAAKFPMLSQFFGPSTSIRSNGDTDYIVTDAYSGVAANDELGIAQPVYMHNVMPVSHGYQSVDYKTILDNTCNEQDSFDQIIQLEDYNGMNHLLSPAGGQNFISSDAEVWRSTQLPTDIRFSGDVSFAHVRQETYVCYKNQGVFKYDPISKTLQPVTLIGLDSDQVAGITSAVGILIAWTTDTIYYSSFEDPADFTPSLRTGAGSASLVPLRGQIVAALPHTSGFIVYSTKNAVYAQATSDLAYPFNYTEVTGSAGIISPRHVASDTTFSLHYAWTKAGMQTIRQNEARLVFPEITDMLTCGYIEDYINSFDGEMRIGSEVLNPNHPVVQQAATSQCPNNLVKLSHDSPLEIRINVVASRYLAISYGIQKLNHAIIYDIGLARFGKLRIPHTDVFTYERPESFGEDNARKSFGFLQHDGTIKVLEFALNKPATDSVFLFGRLSLNRASMTLLDEVHLGGLFDPSGTLTLNIILSIDGMTLMEDIYAIPTHATDSMKKYGLRITGMNHILKLMGTFSLSSIEAVMFEGGSR